MDSILQGWEEEITQDALSLKNFGESIEFVNT